MSFLPASLPLSLRFRWCLETGLPRYVTAGRDMHLKLLWLLQAVVFASYGLGFRGQDLGSDSESSVPLR